MWQEDLVHDLKTAGHGEKAARLASWAERTGMSRPQLYRVAATFGYDAGRKMRSDAGVLKCGLTDGQIELVAGLIYETRREVKGPIMPVERSMDISSDSGIIDSGQVSVSRMQQILSRRALSKGALKEEKPYQPMRSLYPNHVHVVDSSTCIQYYLRGKKGLAIMDEREFYKNKLHKFASIKLRLLRYIITDHFSGAFYVRYFNTTGETQANLYDVLIEAWGPKEDDRYPFRGVPSLVLWDAGSANTARAMSTFLTRLGVEAPKGTPHNSRRQGGTEVMHNIWEMWFEAGLRLDPATTIDDLNEKARDMAIWYNATRPHTRHGMTRTGAWLLITPDKLRELPSRDILQELLTYTGEDLTRRVSRDYSISYRAREWNVRHIPKILPGRSTVQVVIRPYTPDVIAAEFDGITYDLTEIKTLPSIEGGFRADAAIIGQEYKSQPETATQKAIKRIDKMAFGEEKKKDAIPFEGLTVFGNHADKVDLTYIARKGTPIEIDRAIVKKDIPIAELFKRLVSRVGSVSRELNSDLRGRYGTSIDAEEADRVITAIEDGTYRQGYNGQTVEARQA